MDTNNSVVNSSYEPSAKQVYTVPEIIEILQISKNKAYELCKQNLFRTISIGRTIRISKESFDKWLNEQN